MTHTTVDLREERATLRLGAAIGRLLRPGDAVLLDGPLGAGKSTLARAILRAACNAPGLEVPSPTYTISQEYESPMGPITHLDLWRLEGAGALAELDWSGAREGAVIVEWPDRLEALRPDDALTIAFAVDPDGARLARLRGWSSERLDELLTLAGGGAH